MNPQKAQLYWSAVIAVTVALIGIHNLFAQNSSAHLFSEISPPAADIVKDGFVIR
jgi:hypothetical protein